MINTYCTKVCTQRWRWPMVVFYTIVDIAALNTIITWLHKNPKWEIKNSVRRRRRFLKDLGMDLVVPYMKRRMEQANGLKVREQDAMKTILGMSAVQPLTTSASFGTVSAGKCNVCISENYGEGYKKAKSNANKVKQRCERCKKPACKKKHSKQSLLCSNCSRD